MVIPDGLMLSVFGAGLKPQAAEVWVDVMTGSGQSMMMMTMMMMMMMMVMMMVMVMVMVMVTVPVPFCFCPRLPSLRRLKPFNGAQKHQTRDEIIGQRFG